MLSRFCTFEMHLSFVVLKFNLLLISDQSIYIECKSLHAAFAPVSNVNYTMAHIWMCNGVQILFQLCIKLLIIVFKWHPNLTIMRFHKRCRLRFLFGMRTKTQNTLSFDVESSKVWTIQRVYWANKGKVDEQSVHTTLYSMSIWPHNIVHCYHLLSTKARKTR